MPKLISLYFGNGVMLIIVLYILNSNMVPFKKRGREGICNC